MKRTLALIGVLVLLIVATSGQSAERLPAFPGAEGFGAVSIGGRGGQVINVTNLRTRGPGSLQAACSAANSRCRHVAHICLAILSLAACHLTNVFSNRFIKRGPGFNHFKQLGIHKWPA